MYVKGLLELDSGNPCCPYSTGTLDPTAGGGRITVDFQPGEVKS